MKAKVMVMALLLVSTTLVAPVSASTTTPDSDNCDSVDLTVRLFNPLDDTSDCWADVDEIRQGSKAQERADILSRAETMQADQETTVTAYHNTLENARTVAWTKAEVAALKALENNSSQAETRVAARAAVEAYYSRMIQNLLQYRDSRMQELEYLAETRDNLSLASAALEVHVYGFGSVVDTSYDWTLTEDNTNAQVTLPNGSVYNMTTFSWGYTDQDTGVHHSTQPLYWGDNIETVNEENHYVDYIRFYSSYDNQTATAYNSSEIDALVQEMQSQNTQMLSNINETVNGLYGSYVRGELDIEEYRSVQATAMGWSPDLNSTGYSIYAVTALGQAGEEIPDLNQTGSMTIETSEFTANNSSETLTGLMTGSPPSGDAWTVNTTYDPANANGSLMFHVSASNRSVELTEPFTLVGAEDSDGSEIQQVQMQRYNYRTSNFSELGDKLDRLIELRQEEQIRIEEASSGGGGGGGGIGWPGSDTGGFGLGGGVVMLAIAAVLVGIGVKLYFEVMTP
ncbi:hypothetical protein [Haloarchaeobius iranensis]|uniref:Envelope protein N-terminal domain-containing protein n=1 Tax=Haloarchaeobius iranensis TaxID=996166 RepID=A0A1G9XZB0_9EURY|nr:hypothetical protein [Haloarchaeobius iranensis]SDN01816.1 hypothetical protein SAMN05192554_11246 [Haloarchaeobius iranensis]